MKLNKILIDNKITYYSNILNKKDNSIYNYTNNKFIHCISIRYINNNTQGIKLVKYKL
jgi:hypothetical protein